MATCGQKVVRGRDWKWGDQDGGEGFVGTLVANDRPKIVNVQWDHGTVANYRAGAESSYDLRCFDNAQCGVRHDGISCNECNAEDIPGMRWKCGVCENVNLCSPCYMADAHDITHAFIRFTTSQSSPIGVPMRCDSVSVAASGLFSSAIVVRSHGWKWANQDGGESHEGELLELVRWAKGACRDGARVRWKNGGAVCLYRLGHDGKVDVQCKKRATGGKYYPLHLPLIGKAEEVSDCQPAAASAAAPAAAPAAAVGTQLKYDMSARPAPNAADAATSVASKSSNNGMPAPLEGRPLEAVAPTASPDLGWFKTNGLAPATAPEPTTTDAPDGGSSFKVGDAVVTELPADILEEVQRAVGGWRPGLAKVICKTGKVVQVSDSGQVDVEYEQLGRYTFHPAALTKVF